MSVVGIDACKRGWVAIALRSGEPPTGLVVDSLDRLSAELQDIEAVAIDIPIGLPVDGRRQADVEARRILGPRRSSVFLTPVRQSLTAPTHAQASAIAKRLSGHGISRQAYALAPRILEAEQWSARVTAPVWEVHPEVSFTAMTGSPMESAKTTWAGMQQRRRALAGEGITLEDIGEAGRHAAVDDVLDAAAAAWSASRLHRGRGWGLPDPPEMLPGAAQPVAIWA